MKDTKMKVSQNIAAEIMVVAFLGVNIAKLFFIIPIFEGNMILLGIGLLSLGLNLLYNGIMYNKTYLLFIIMYMICGLIGYCYNGNIEIREIAWPMAYMNVGMLFYNATVSFELMKKINYAFLISILIAMWQYDGVDNLIMSASRNIVSCYVLMFFSFYVITGFFEKKDLSIGVAFLGACVCVMAVGRSGIIMGIAMVLFFIVFKFNKGNAEFRLRKMGGWLNAVCIFILLIIFFDCFYEWFEVGIDNFENRGFESSARFEIWNSYIEKMSTSLWDILLGKTIGNSLWLDAFHSNMHNSFIMLHAKYGIAPMIIIIGCIFMTIFLSKSVYFLMPMSLLLFRMQTDYINFNGFLDTVLVIYIMFPFYRRKITINDKG